MPLRQKPSLIIIACLLFFILAAKVSLSILQIQRDLENLRNFPQDFTEAYKKIKIFDAWNLLDALMVSFQRVNIGVVDSGVDTKHPEFAGEEINGNIIGRVDFGLFRPVFGDREPGGHGTQVAGIIGANNLSAFTTIPTSSPQMNGIVAGATSTYIIQSGAVPFGTYVEEIFQTQSVINSGASIVNIGSTRVKLSALSPIQQASIKGQVSDVGFFLADKVWRAMFFVHPNTMFVIPSGNSGIDVSNEVPAHLADSFLNVVAVGGTTIQDKRWNDPFGAEESNFGNGITLSAPAEEVYTTRLFTEPLGFNDYDINFSGTSASAPMVTGVAAILKSLKPNLTPAEIKNILITTADPIQTGEPDKRIGTGCYSNPNDPVNTGCRLNAFRAVQHTLTGCIPPPSNLVAWWPGDGHFKDISANEHHAAPFNGATTTPDGFVDGSFLFDGMNDYLAVPHDTAFHPLASSGFSIDTWVNLSSAQPPNQHIIDKSHVFINEWAFQGAGGDIFERGSNRFTNAGEVNWGLAAGPTATETDPFIHVGTIIPVNDNTWHHITATWDGSLMKMYLDGILKETVPFSGPVLSNTFPLHIGFEPVTGASSLKGQIDELEVFNRALTQQEIQSIFTAGQAGKCKPTVSSSTPEVILPPLPTIPATSTNP